MSIYLDTNGLVRGITPDTINNQNKLIRMNGPGLGFCSPEEEPLAYVEVVVSGKEYDVDGRVYQEKARVVRTDGGYVMVPGDLNASVPVKSANEILGRSDRQSLTRALHIDGENKRNKLVNEKKS